MICLQGHTAGMPLSLDRPKDKGDEEDLKGGDRDFCIRALKEGFSTIALEQCSMDELDVRDGRVCYVSLCL